LGIDELKFELKPVKNKPSVRLTRLHSITFESDNKAKVEAVKPKEVIALDVRRSIESPVFPGTVRIELDEEMKKNLIGRIERGESIPVQYKNLLFPLEKKPKEIELVYGGKVRKEDILSDTMSVPFQAVKQFGNLKGEEWHNKLIFGDNLQVLKFMLKDSKVAKKVKLIYIDPPFATKQEFQGGRGEIVYSDRITGAEFLEFLRKRLILLMEMLANEGCICVHMDYRKGHYIKILLDEVFKEHNFRNEIAVKRGTKSVQAQFETIDSLASGHDTIFLYSKQPSLRFKKFTAKLEEIKKGTWNNHWRGTDRPTMRYELFGITPTSGQWRWSQKRTNRAIKNYEKYVAKYSKEKPIDEYYLEVLSNTGKKLDFVRLSSTGKPEHYVPPKNYKLLSDVWFDISAYERSSIFPTQKSEALLERLINNLSNKNDIILDAFAGSGTTGAVAEKLGRKWIMIDSSKFAIYTIIKRMFNLRQRIGNKGKRLQPSPFVLYNAGLYEDHSFILGIGSEQYKKFAMELFQVEAKYFEINGLGMDGILFNCPVKVFSQKGYLTEDYIDELHETVGEQLKSRMFVIAPASRVYFLQDYIEKNGIRYYVLRIPYSVIDELHKRTFTRPIQPTSSVEINTLIEQTGFDFICPPEVRVKYYRKKPKDRLIKEELIIEIEDFKAVQRSKRPIEFKDSKEALSMVLVDTKYNGEYLNMTHYFFKDQIEKDGWKIKIPATNIGKQIMIIYLDILGNERVEVKSQDDFKRR